MSANSRSKTYLARPASRKISKPTMAVGPTMGKLRVARLKSGRYVFLAVCPKGESRYLRKYDENQMLRAVSRFREQGYEVALP